jgi:uncharacterized protein (DUF4415 family)
MTYNDAMKAWGQQYGPGKPGGCSPEALAELRLLFKGGHDLSEEKLKRLSSNLRRREKNYAKAQEPKARAKARARQNEPKARAKARAKRMKPAARKKAAAQKRKRRAAKRKPAPPAEVIALRLSQSRDWGAFHKQTLEARDGRWKDIWTNFNAKRLKRTKN